MKILAQIDYFLAGFQGLMEAIGHQWIWWPPGKPAFDAFDEFKPDMLMTKGNEAPTGVSYCIEETTIPWIKSYEDHVSFEVKDSHTHSINIPPMVDPLTFRPTEPNPKLACDISYIGPVNATMLKLCHDAPQLNIKISGPTHWPVVQCLGDMSPDQARQLFSSSKVVYAETVEEALRAVACKAPFVTINQGVEEMWEECDNFLAGNYDELLQLIDEKLRDPEIAKANAEVDFKAVIPTHTSLTFMQTILNALDFTEEENKVKRFINDRYEK